MDLVPLIEQNAAGPLALVALALVLGALHGLEPGHSKAMMGAFIIAVRGTAWQAVLLGLSAAVAHTAIVWLLALLALHYGDALSAGAVEPWLVLASGLVILAIALRLMLRQRPRARDHHHDNDHDHDHGEPHGHDHEHPADAHAAGHARAIEQHFAAGRASHGQVILFGLSGGLVPCTAAVTLLILCLHLQKVWLGVALVGGFSLGLAATLVAFGLAVAWGRAVLRGRGRRLARLARLAPVLSALLVGAIGLVMVISGLRQLL